MLFIYRSIMSVLNITNVHLLNGVTRYNVSTTLNSNATKHTNDTALDDLNRKYAAALLPFTVALAALGVAGVLGNIRVFIVYGGNWQLKDKKVRVYILSLAALDFMTCLTLIPAEIWKHRAYFNFEKAEVCKTKCFLNVFAASSASYCLLLIALDRYILTCHPLLFVKLRSFSYATSWRLCVLMIGLGFITALPSAFLCGIARESMTTEDGSRVMVHLCESEPYYESSVGRYAYKLALCIVQVLISVILTVLYARIGRVVRRVVKIRKCGSTRSTRSGTITEADMNIGEEEVCTTCHNTHAHLPLKVKVLFVVTLVYIVTHAFYMILAWIDQTKMTPVQFAVFSIFFRMYFIHSMINPFLYLKMDRHFRNRSIRLLNSILCRSGS